MDMYDKLHGSSSIGKNKNEAHSLGNQHSTCPVAAVLDVGRVGHSAELSRRAHGSDLGLRLVSETRGTTAGTLSQTLLGSGNSERSGGEEHLAEESSSEHDGDERRREKVDSKGLSELGVSRAEDFSSSR